MKTVTGCSPHHIACAIQAGATRIGLGCGQAAAGTGEVARYIDHTLLKPEATRAEIETLCAEARDFSFASVCVNPTWVKECAFSLLWLAGQGLHRGWLPARCDACRDVKAYEARRAIFDGATEIDMVINIGALKSGDDDVVRVTFERVVEAAHEACAIVKVILETALLTDDEKVRACLLSKDAGADFVKTSTGFSKGGATVADIALDAPGGRLGDGRQGRRWSRGSCLGARDDSCRRDADWRECGCQDRAGSARSAGAPLQPRRPIWLVLTLCNSPLLVSSGFHGMIKFGHLTQR